jgi:hypothetical protein
MSNSSNSEKSSERANFKHTPGPWFIDGPEAISAPVDPCNPHGDWSSIVEQPNFSKFSFEANAARIVECVNAMNGLNPKAVLELMYALTAHVKNPELYPVNLKELLLACKESK